MENTLFTSKFSGYSGEKKSCSIVSRNILTFLLAFLAVGGLMAQVPQKAEMVKKIQPMSQEEISDYYKTVHSRIPNPKHLEAMRKIAQPSDMPVETKSTKGVQLPEKIWFPGEFEEVQAIYVTFPSYAMFRDGSGYAYPLFDKVGCNSNYSKIDSVYYFIDTFANQSRMPIIFAELINGIQQHAQAWINLWDISDSTALKSFMQNLGMPLTNYRFFEAGGNSFWYRDCGPVAFYYGDNDDIAFMDFEYYGGRPADDDLPIRLGKDAGYPVYTTSIEYEGGNIIVDGAGTLFTSDALYAANQDRYGQYYWENNTIKEHTKAPLTRAKVNDSLMHLMNLDRLFVLPTLQYDGGTGHIDLYADMWDEEHFVFSKHPEALSSLTDYPIVAKNIDSISSLYSVFERNYKKDFIPFPKRDNNTWYTSDDDYEYYTRTYSNHTMVNKAIIQPMFSNNTWGATEWEKAALDSMKAKYPGYEFIPIDVRGRTKLNGDGFDGMGGAIHCITKQIPAENPIRILHKSRTGNDYATTFPMTATITNRSGIASASCVWRIKGSGSWNTTPMTAGADNLFTATIEGDPNAVRDTIEYYISATSNNGKTITKPITAPKGSYEFYFGSAIGIQNVDKSSDVIFGQFYPNPAKGSTRIEIQNAKHQSFSVKVLNIKGEIVYSTTTPSMDEHMIFEMKTNSFASGLYTVVFYNKSEEQIVRKLIIQ